MKHFEMSVTVGAFMLPIIIAIIGIVIVFGWQPVAVLPLFILMGALSFALCLTLSDELADYRKSKNTSERV